ncbi:L-glutamate gamma-semialdehyde dehydrogenase, partial [candidate division KSB1 bacterium]
PLTDFSKEENRAKMENAINKVESELGKEWSLIIGGKRIRCRDQFFSRNPSDYEHIIGIFQKAEQQHVVMAIEAANKAFETWKFTPAEERAEYCFKIADLIRENKFEFSAWMVLEIGKSWVEADADVAEAIDLIDFYACEAVRYGSEQSIVKIPSEENKLRYIPLGVGVVIAPWNFPLAILSGMTVGALAAGNTVILKPSSDAPAVAKKFMEILEHVKLPDGVVNLLTGPGGDIGDLLVIHPQTRFISFTGSKEVGLRINEHAARTSMGQKWIKRVVAEMGGKNAIIVDSEAKIDNAVEGVAISAFGYSGQKCSACSRAIVSANIYDEFIEKLIDRTKNITIGPVKYYENWMGPVINLKAMATIMDYIELGKREGRLLCGGKRINHYGNFIESTIIDNLDRKATICQHEIFGPVLAVIKSQDFEDAIEIANDTEYGLTGSVYSENKGKLEKAGDLFHVGNLYYNRKCTGAVVGAHPFGGFNMSGTDSKAGGRDYLLLFSQAKSISKNIK